MGSFSSSMSDDELSLEPLELIGSIFLHGPLLFGEISFSTTTIPNQICAEGAVMFYKKNISFFLQVVGFHFKKKKQVQIKKKWFGQTDFGSVNHDREACSLRRSDCLRYALLSKYFFRFPNRLSEISLETRTRGKTSLNINHNDRLTNTNTARSNGLGTPKTNSGSNLKKHKFRFLKVQCVKIKGHIDLIYFSKISIYGHNFFHNFSSTLTFSDTNTRRGQICVFFIFLYYLCFFFFWFFQIFCHDGVPAPTVEAEEKQNAAEARTRR